MSVRIINLDCREGMAAMDACSVDAIVTDGIEIDAEYCEIARNRIASDIPLFA